MPYKYLEIKMNHTITINKEYSLFKKFNFFKRKYPLLLLLWGNFPHKLFVRFGEPSSHGFVLQATWEDFECSNGTLMLVPRVGHFFCRCRTALKVFPCRLQNKTVRTWLPKADKQLVREITPQKRRF